MHVFTKSNASSTYTNSLQQAFQTADLYGSSRVNLTLFFREKSFQLKYVAVLI